MADNKNTGIIVGLVSLALVGTAVFFVIRATKKTPPPTEPQPQPTGGDTGTQPATAPAPQKDVLGQIGGIVGSITDLFKKKASQSGADKYTGFTFPIEVGQSGANVRKLQQMILSANKNLLPKFGADGKFGSETATALKTLIGKNRIDSQADIDTIKTNAYNSASKVLMNQQLGIKLF
jgi:hypothetical protein